MGNQAQALQFIAESGSVRLLQNTPEYFQDGYIILGPPGTGKTAVITVGSLMHLGNDDDQYTGGNRRRAQVGIATFTNSAAIRVVESFHNIFTECNLLESERKQLLAHIVAGQEWIGRGLSDYQISTHPQLEDDLPLWVEGRAIVQSARIIVGTVYGIRSALFGREYGLSFNPDILLFDEASQINISKLNLGFYRGAERLNAIGLVGDPSQLGPISNIRDLLTDSISTLRGSAGSPQRIWRVTQLDWQRRMHPVIRQLAEFFGNYLVPINDYFDTLSRNLGSPNPDFQPPDSLESLFSTQYRIVLLDYSDLSSQLGVGQDMEVGTSRINQFEGKLTLKIAELILQAFPELDPLNDIMVVVPYSEQALIMRNQNQFKIGTVDMFQGQEARIVFASTVRTAMDSPSDLRFVADINRLNVLVSRAQSKLVLVTLRSIYENEPAYSRIFSYVDENQETCSTIQISQDILQELGTGGIDADI